MKLPSVGGIESFALLAGLAVGGYVLYKFYKGGINLKKQLGEIISTDLNPASDKNLVYRSANSMFFGSNGETVGTKVYDIFNHDKVGDMLKGGLGKLPPNTPANGQTVHGVSDMKTSSTNTGTVDANPLTRTKSMSYSWQG